MKATRMKWIGLLALAVFPLYSGYSQNAPAPVAPAAPATPPTAPAPNNPPPVMTIAKPTGDMTEVLKLTKAGVGEDVVVAFVKNSHTYYNLSANDILHLKEEGVSAVVLSAMLTHDSSLRNQGLNQPPAQFNYNQQSFGPGGQLPPGQSIAPPPQQPDGSAGNVQIATPPLVPTAPPAGSQPPPDQTEVAPASPGADYYWAPGYWGWNGGWIWIGGGWYPHGYYGWGWHGGWHGGYRGGWGGGSHGGSSHGGGSHGGGGWGRSGH